ncbi:MAG: hypothetical protein HQM14_18810 [SAR324 cluster bacterium]|nr:hypothetical protein [SAR324 cluster bacterium]
MKEEYDFSKGERGQFFNSDANIHIPIYLDNDNFGFIEKIAKRKKSEGQVRI